MSLSITLQGASIIGSLTITLYLVYVLCVLPAEILVLFQAHDKGRSTFAVSNNVHFSLPSQQALSHHRRPTSAHPRTSLLRVGRLQGLQMYEEATRLASFKRLNHPSKDSLATFVHIACAQFLHLARMKRLMFAVADYVRYNISFYTTSR